MTAISTSNPTNHLDGILAAQRAAFSRQEPPTLSRRRVDLKKLRAAILARRNEIEAALNADFGHRSRHETAIMDVVSVILGIDYLHRNLRRFMRPTRRYVALPFRFGSAWIEYQPLGVVGILAPWNYPVSLALMPLATAIAAENRVMIKPSEFTPATSNLLAAMLADTLMNAPPISRDSDRGCHLSIRSVSFRRYLNHEAGCFSCRVDVAGSCRSVGGDEAHHHPRAVKPAVDVGIDTDENNINPINIILVAGLGAPPQPQMFLKFVDCRVGDPFILVGLCPNAIREQTWQRHQLTQIQ